jgi:Homeodomain-like domain/HNH endonuclease
VERDFVRWNCEHLFVSRIDEVSELHAQGLTGKAIAEQLGVSPPTVCRYLRKLGVEPRPKSKYDWTAVQHHYDQGSSARETRAHFGMSSQTWHDAMKRGRLETRPQAMPIELLVARPRNRNHLKRRLIAAGLLEPRCVECGIDEWRGRPIALQLHHINGVGQDNRLENLALLCPNCHAQTETWGGRNRRRAAG